MNWVRLTIVLFAAGASALAGTGPGAAAKARLLMNAGIAHESQGRNTAALADFTNALKLKTLSPADRVRAIFDRGVALDALGRTKVAIGDYSGAIRLDPRFAPALSNRANAYRRLGRLAEAKRDYLAALAASTAAREYPYYGLGQIAEKQGDQDSARDYYRKALAANPGYALAAQSLARLHPFTSRTPAVVLPPPPVGRAPQTRAPVQAAAKTEAAPVLRQAIVDSHVKPAPPPGTAQIQLGAFHDQASALAGWDKVAAAAGGALQGLSPNVVPVDLPGKGRLWRLRAAVADKAAARHLCAELAARGLACVLARD